MYAWGQYAERHGYRYIRMLVQPTAPPKAPKGMVRTRAQSRRGVHAAGGHARGTA